MFNILNSVRLDNLFYVFRDKNAQYLLRISRRVFGPKRDEVTGEWRKLHNEELSDLYSLSNNVRVVKSRRMRWEGHMARMGEGERCAQGSGGET